MLLIGMTRSLIRLDSIVKAEFDDISLTNHNDNDSGNINR